MTVPAGLFDQLDLSDEEFADATRAVTARMLQGDADPVSTGMTDFLVRAAPRGRSKSTARTVECILFDYTYAGQLTAQHGTVQAAYALARSLSTCQVAILLSWTMMTVTRTAGRTLYAYREGRSLRFPTWQFHEGRPIPDLATVVPALCEGLMPVTIEARMTTLDSELLDGATPAQWLIVDGDPAAVTRQLSDADHR